MRPKLYCARHVFAVINADDYQKFWCNFDAILRIRIDSDIVANETNAQYNHEFWPNKKMFTSVNCFRMPNTERSYILLDLINTMESRTNFDSWQTMNRWAECSKQSSVITVHDECISVLFFSIFSSAHSCCVTFANVISSDSVQLLAITHRKMYSTCRMPAKMVQTKHDEKIMVFFIY